MYPWHQKQCLWCLVSVLSEYMWGKPLPEPDSGFCQKFQLKPWNHVLEIPQNPLIFHEPRKSFDFLLLLRFDFSELLKFFIFFWVKRLYWILFCCNKWLCLYRLKYIRGGKLFFQKIFPVIFQKYYSSVTTPKSNGFEKSLGNIFWKIVFYTVCISVYRGKAICCNKKGFSTIASLRKK